MCRSCCGEGPRGVFLWTSAVWLGADTSADVNIKGSSALSKLSKWGVAGGLTRMGYRFLILYKSYSKFSFRMHPALADDAAWYYVVNEVYEVQWNIRWQAYWMGRGLGSNVSITSCLLIISATLLLCQCPQELREKSKWRFFCHHCHIALIGLIQAN